MWATHQQPKKNTKIIPSGKLTVCNGKIHHFFMGKSTISMAIFNCFLYVHQRVIITIFGIIIWDHFKVIITIHKPIIYGWLLVTGTMGILFMTFQKHLGIYFIIPTDEHSMIFQRGRAQPPSSINKW